MSNPTADSKIAAILEQMAESYYPEHEYNDIWRERNAELVAEAATQLQQLIIEAQQNVINVAVERSENDDTYTLSAFGEDMQEYLNRTAQLNKEVES